MALKGAVAVFVKTPGLSSVKTRLAESIGKDKAQTFFELSCDCIEETLTLTAKQSELSIDPYWAVAEEGGMRNPRWSSFERVFQGSGGLGDRLHEIYSQLTSRYDYVMLMGADSPQVSSSNVSEAASILSGGSKFVIGLAEDGGFYLFGGGHEVNDSVWKTIPYSSYDTGERLQDLVSRIAPVKNLPTQLDVDNIEDLERLARQLKSRKDLTKSQQKLSHWLDGVKPL